MGGGRWGERCRPVGRWRTAAGGGAGGIQRLRRLRRRQWGRRRQTRRWWRRWGREGVRGARRINLRAKINHKVSHGEQGWCDAGGAAAGGRQTSRARSRACAACPQGDARLKAAEATARAGLGGGAVHTGTWASSGGARGGSRGSAHPEEVTTRWSRLTIAASSPCPQTALLHWTSAKRRPAGGKGVSERQRAGEQALGQ